MDFWAQVLSTVAKRISRQCFDTWFRPIVFQGCDKGIVHLVVPNQSFRKFLLDNYSSVLSDAIKQTSQIPLKINLTVEPALTPEVARPVCDKAGNSRNCSQPLIPKYNFDTFVVGSCNQFARAAAMAVAEQPSKAYNPLYIYGGVGLGKTHLMHAIGNLIQQRNKGVHLAYISAENFMNHLVNAIRYDHTIQFRQNYRNIDVLLMDDIQFIAGKERTQEEFFHTFNALYDSQKQIVITSDCPPKEIPTLEERLHSRFEWGLIADIQLPDLETKLAILRKKAEPELHGLPDDVAIYLASCVRSNIRELEGALNRLSARASLDGLDVSDIDLGYAKEVLKNVIPEDKQVISSEMVLRAVASFFCLKPAKLKSKNNSRPIALPRQIAMYICKQLTNQSLPQIGRDFGGKHHTTVLHSIRKIDSLRKKNSEISDAVNKIMKSLR